MSTSKKRIGDSVIITAGESKNMKGTIFQQQQRGWIIKLENAQLVKVTFRMVRLAEQSIPVTFAADSPREESALEQQLANSEIDSQYNAEQLQISENEQLPVDESVESNVQTAKSTNIDFTTLGVVQLRELAKRRGISIARTKEDFIRIIREMDPEQDLNLLKGRTLFDRVSELHISRLRSKQDLIERLRAE